MSPRLAAAVLLILVGCTAPAAPAPPVPTVIPSPSPQATLAAEILRQGTGGANSAPFALPGGTYRVLWTAGLPNRSPCLFLAIVRSTTDAQMRVIVADSRGQAGPPVEGEGWVYNVPAGQYYLDVTGSCQWAAQILDG
jgi:hypothetical protein